MTKKIIIIVDGFPQLSETFIVNHIVSLIENGWKVDIIANRFVPGPHQQLVDDFNLLNLTAFTPKIPLNRFMRLFVFFGCFTKVFFMNPVVALRSLNFFKLGKGALTGRVVISLLPYFKLGKPDIIHCHFGTNGFNTEKALVALKWKVPFFVSFHGYDTIPENFRYLNYGRMFSAVNKVFVNSNYLANRVINLGCDSNKIIIIPVGILESKSNKYERKNDLFTFITVARLDEVKGIEYSIKAFRLFRDECPEAVFQYIIIGNGPLKLQLENLVSELGLKDDVQFTGALASHQIEKYLASASVFIMTGITATLGNAETQGLAYQEAAGFGLPLIGSDAGGVPEYVLNDITGLIAREKDIQGIKAKIKLLYFDAGLRKRLGETAKQYAKEKFDQGKLTRKMIQVYENI